MSKALIRVLIPMEAVCLVCFGNKQVNNGCGFQVIDDFVQRSKKTDATIISQEIFVNDPTFRVENLKVNIQTVQYLCKEF